MKSYYLVLLSLFILFSCDGNGKKDTSYLQKSLGNINSLQVIISNDLWNGVVGEEIRTHFAAPAAGLPQDEPLFSMNQMPPSTFTGFARKNRLFLHLTLGDSNEIKLKDHPYAKPQTGAILVGSSQEELIALIRENQERIIAAFKKSEITERQRRTSISTMKLDSMPEKLGVSMKIPSAYHIAKATNDFYWIRKELKSGSTNIIVYEVPLEMIGKDSTIIGDIIKIRDSIGGVELPVEDDGQFITERAYAPFLYSTKLDGKFAYETKGTWEVKNEYMAGPFVNYAVKDEVNNRYVILEGFTHAPSVGKRDLQFELESILKSAKIK